MLAILKVAGRAPADQTAAIKRFDRPVPFRWLAGGAVGTSTAHERT